MAVQEIKVPDIGDFADVDVIEVHIEPGATVAVEDPLITVESDKASMDVPAPAAGTIEEVRIKVGDKVSEGTVVALLATDGESTAAPEPDPKPAAAAPQSAPTGDDAAEDVKVPDIGDFAEVEIIEVHVKPGDEIKAEDPLITLESDKASMDVPAPRAGTVKDVKVKVGDKVSEGIAILSLASAGGAAAPAPDTAATKTAAPSPAPATQGPETGAPARSIADFSRIHASPVVRRLARELGVDLNQVPPTGAKGRVSKDDVQNFARGGVAPAGKPAAAAPAGAMGIPPIPAVDFSKFGEIETKPLNKIKRLTALNLHRSWLNVPHVTHHDEADITELEAFRQALKPRAEKAGVRVTLLAFFMQACAATLQAFPTFNASLDPGGENLILKKYFNIGIAVDTPNGLVVPVIRDVDQKGLFELSAELGEASGKARDKKLKPGDMQGATFTISSLGGIGGTGFTPIVNAPEVAILGLTRSQLKPVPKGDSFEFRLLQPMSLSYDHRVVDGAEAARFVKHLGELVSDVRLLLT